MASVSVPGGVTQTVIASADMGYDVNGWYHVREGYARGKNVALPVRPNRYVMFPMTLNTTGRNIQEGPNGRVATEETGVAKFMLLQTQNANAASESVEDAIARFANSMRVQGYTEIFLPE